MLVAALGAVWALGPLRIIPSPKVPGQACMAYFFSFGAAPSWFL